jgi:hypothetical protein
VGGWFYVRSWIEYGSPYPHALAPHRIMLTMPPGEREIADYFRIPLATWTDPQLLSPDLLRSIWGSTYVTLWFDGHRHFLPRSGEGVQWLGTAILLLALLPTAAFLAGVAGGARRSFLTRSTPDAPLLILVAMTMLGYTVFTWRNPWYAAVKGSYLLGLSVPFAFYASEVLARWTQRRRLSFPVWALLVALWLCVAAAFTYGLVFAKDDPVGLPWK